MTNKYRKFISESDSVSFNKEHRKIINFNINKYDQAVLKGRKQYKSITLAKKKAAHIKRKTINELENNLNKFEKNFEKNGGKIIWAEDAVKAVDSILQIINENKTKLVVKSKSMTTEEIDLNDALIKSGVETIETDLGEYIVQIADEKPYHIVTPAMHKSKDNIAELFNEKFNTPKESSPEEITSFVRKLLRKKFINADVGITGANFLIADTGSACITENEGNGMLSVSIPDIHIVIAGIEKIIPSLEDLHTFWPLLASHGTGQNITVYNSILSGPKKQKEYDGPKKMYVVLLDNERTNLLKQEKQKIALTCIRCGACLNACPVYRNIGGYTYNSVYSGPIGAVITPFLKSFEDYKHLSYASSLCGKCTEVCPVKIPLHELLLYNRKYTVDKKFTMNSERIGMFGYKKIMQNRKLMNAGNHTLKNYFIKAVFRKSWGRKRILPKVASKSFNELKKQKI